MTSAPSNETTPRQPLRLWPGVVAVVLQWLLWLLAPIVVPEASLYGFLGALACGMAVLVWWLFFSRARWSERLGAIALMVLAVAATSLVVHESISNGMMGMMLPMYSIPVLSLALVAWAVATRRVGGGLRWASMAAAILLACGAFTLIRTGGITGDARSDLHWRWTPTPEARLLARTSDTALDSPRDELLPARAPAPAGAPSSTAAPASAPVPATETSPPVPAAPAAPPTSETVHTAAAGSPAPASTPAAAEPLETPDDTEAGEEPLAHAPEIEWPGFRGPARDGVVRGVRIETAWSRTPPVELWRRPIGPGWSSFAVHGALIYTQEQRGDDEVVSAYDLSTGEPVWRHADPVRFWESNGGAGPRATPTVRNGRVYSVGATGIVNALDAGTGALVWSRDAATDTATEVPDWGFAGSPLVTDDLVIVALDGQLVAYGIDTGDRRWLGPSGGAGYSSPHLLTIDGVAQVLLLRGSRTISVAPADGTLLWEHTWQPGVGFVQPALLPDGDVLLTVADAMGGFGMRRVSVAHGPGGWSVEERWTSRGLKPYFNDFVVHEGHAFGFDGSILSCIDLEDGQRMWKGGRYGHGQLVLLPDEDVLLVLSEQGELALVRAASDKYTELARVPAIEGKTWNHPVVVGDVLLVRNGEEMAAFRLPRAGS